MNPNLLWVVALWGCGSRPILPTDNECEERHTPLSQANWSGPSEADVLAEVAAYVPVHAVWDEYTLGDASSPLSVLPARTADEPSVVERTYATKPCTYRPGPELTLPMTFALDIGSGMVTGQVPGTLAVGLDAPTIWLDLQGPVTLAPAWAEPAALDVEARSPNDGAPEWYASVSTSDWVGARIEIGAFTENSSMTLWRGHWSDQAP